jgi:hypothetical protein
MILYLPGTDVVLAEDVINNRHRMVKLTSTLPSYNYIFNLIDVYDIHRFIVSEKMVKRYNEIFKQIRIGRGDFEYYVQNDDSSKFISYLRKNHRLFMDFCMMEESKREAILSNFLPDILYNSNINVIYINEMELQSQRASLYKSWSGTAVLYNPDYIL